MHAPAAHACRPSQHADRTVQEQHMHAQGTQHAAHACRRPPQQADRISHQQHIGVGPTLTQEACGCSDAARPPLRRQHTHITKPNSRPMAAGRRCCTAAARRSYAGYCLQAGGTSALHHKRAVMVVNPCCFRKCARAHAPPANRCPHRCPHTCVTHVHA